MSVKDSFMLFLTFVDAMSHGQFLSRVSHPIKFMHPIQDSSSVFGSRGSGITHCSKAGLSRVSSVQFQIVSKGELATERVRNF